jgi:hypothetical protein
MSIEVGQQFGAWTVAVIDGTQKRVTVICQCGATAQVAADALVSGESKGCGCRLTPRPRVEKTFKSLGSFSSDLAREESHTAVHRHKARP